MCRCAVPEKLPHSAGHQVLHQLYLNKGMEIYYMTMLLYLHRGEVEKVWEIYDHVALPP